MRRDSVAHTLTVAAVLCIICSLLVSLAAVGLRPRQLANKERARRKNILVLTGLYDAEKSIEQSFSEIETRIADLETGRLVDLDQLDPGAFDQRKAAADPELSVAIAADQDLAGIGRREKHSLVYLVRKRGKLDQIVLPVYGKGLWSTMYAYLSMDIDGSTIRGISFYEHGETPGLGGEIENPTWRASWAGKQVYGDDGEVAFQVIKGPVDPNRPRAAHQVDGISGATITANGVTNMVRYWLGPDGFGAFLEQFRMASN